jgi:hypothetical protein
VDWVLIGAWVYAVMAFVNSLMNDRGER